ncbi:helix-turn-helix transcriptional regulator [Saccharothrix sp. ALI-22-I]|nr:helix-turn-helix transcriptional regulator [Saccharothrix sp. ALI-22-I]
MTVLPLSRRATGPAAARVEALLATATQEVLVLSSATTAAQNPVGIRRIDRHNLRRGVRYRLLVPDAARTVPLAAGRLGVFAASGADIRTVPHVPADAFVVDGSLAVLPTDETRAGVAVFQLPGVVATTVELFERMWPGAVPLTASELPGTADPIARERELLTLLSTGCTDEAAAARLGISVRTVRRIVADVMNRLGARSRFQAGAKAADRGWLLPGADR